ncbi:MAG: DciA family protein [Phycisphaerales bacterium]|nr:DciA family protein [Phycisphaerales bacterium]
MPNDRSKCGGETLAKHSRPKKSDLANLEMQGDRLKVFSLHNLLTNKKSPETRATARLGDVLLPWFEKVVKTSDKMGQIAEIWQNLVPISLQNRSRLIRFSRGVLSVALDSAAARAELEARLRSGLLRQLQTESHGTLFRIKTCVQPPAL